MNLDNFARVVVDVANIRPTSGSSGQGGFFEPVLRVIVERRFVAARILRRFNITIFVVSRMDNLDPLTDGRRNLGNRVSSHSPFFDGALPVNFAIGTEEVFVADAAEFEGGFGRVEVYCITFGTGDLMFVV